MGLKFIIRKIKFNELPTNIHISKYVLITGNAEDAHYHQIIQLNGYY